jgi:thiol-disulfide isomerase/thioredoxin
MKKIKFLIGLAVAIITLTSCNSNSFKVEGTVEGVEDGDTLLVFSNGPEPLDTLIVKEGKFAWKGEADSVFLCSVVAQDARAMAMFFREPGTINLLLSATGDSKVSGTESNDALQQLNMVFAESQKKAEELMTKINTDSLDENQQVEIYTQYTELQIQVNEKVKEMALSNLNNEFGYFFFTQLAYNEDFTRDQIMDALSKMPKKFVERQAIKDIQKRIEETFSTGIGQQIQDFNMKSPDDQNISIMNLVKQNKITILDFWASWCMPCREEMPMMKKLLEEYQEKGLGIIGISLDDKKDDWTSCIEELGLNWPQVSDLNRGTSPAVRSFEFQAIPFTVVVDQEGKILARELRGEALAKFISEQLQ